VKVTRILHASVNVSGALYETSRFYADLLGLAGADRPEIPGVDGRWFTAGQGQVHLVDAPMAGQGIDPTGPHFCLGVEDMDAALAELEERGIPFFRATQPGVGSGSGGPDGTGEPTEVVQVWFTDPSGNTVELQQDRPL
jgi:catechol 2,3-dioxygenase-like lactoylglutathione lyase family enzyme